MTFWLQLKILLWKNFTLKLRSPLVLMIEICIPLVLFAIIAYLRSKAPALPESQTHYDSKPLPSAGFIPILESFCEHGQLDSYGFRHPPNSTLRQVLEEFQTNNFFDTGFKIFPSDLENIPETVQLLLDNVAVFYQWLNHLADKRATIQELKEIIQKYSTSNSYKTDLNKAIHQLAYELIKDNPKLILDQQLRKTYAKLVENVSNLNKNMLFEFEIGEYFKILKIVVDSPSSIQQESCTNNKFAKIVGTSGTESTSYLGTVFCNITSSNWKKFGEIVSNAEKLNFENKLLTFIGFENALTTIRKFISQRQLENSCHQFNIKRSGGETVNNHDTIKEERNTLYHVLLKLWEAIQRPLCGLDSVLDSHKDALKLITDLLKGNPMILYSPSGTAADEIMQMNTRFLALFRRSAKYAESWWNVSGKIRSYVHREQTGRKLTYLQEVVLESIM